jgi:hypothetical protein
MIGGIQPLYFPIKPNDLRDLREPINACRSTGLGRGRRRTPRSRQTSKHRPASALD